MFRYLIKFNQRVIMSTISDRFLPLRTTLQEPYPSFTVNALPLWETRSNRIYRAELSKSIFGREVYALPKLNVRTNPIADFNSIAYLPKAKTWDVSHETTKHPFGESFSVGIDKNRFYYLINQTGICIRKHRDTSYDCTHCIPGLFNIFKDVPQSAFGILGTTTGDIVRISNETFKKYEVIPSLEEQIISINTDMPNMVFAGSEDGSLVAVDLRMGEHLYHFKASSKPLTGISVNRSTIMALGYDGDDACLTDLRIPNKLIEFNNSAVTFGHTIAFSPYNPHMLSVSHRHVVKIFDLKHQQTQQIALTDNVTSFFWRPDGFQVTVGLNENWLCYFSENKQCGLWTKTGNTLLEGRLLSAAEYDSSETYYLTSKAVLRVTEPPVVKPTLGVGSQINRLTIR